MLTLFAGAGVLAALAPIIFSLAGLGAGVLLLIAGAAALAWFGFRKLALVLLGLAACQIAAGVMYRQGVSDCEARVRAAVAAEHARQVAVGTAAIAELEERLAAATADDQAAAERLAAFERELAARPRVEACILNQNDAEAINGR